MVSCKISSVSHQFKKLSSDGRTKPLPSNFPKSFKVDLVFRIFKEIFFPSLSTD